MYICLCQAVTDEEIRGAVREGARCVKTLEIGLGVSTQCGKCKPEVKAILKQTLLEESKILSLTPHEASI